MKKSSREIQKISKNIGDKIKQLRMERGASMPEFSKEIGVGYVSLFQWERGQNMRSVAKFALLCKRMKVNPNYFFDAED